MSSAENPRRPGILKNESNEPTAASPLALLNIPQTASPKSTPKSVSIAPKGEYVSPLILGDAKDVDDLDLDGRSPRRPRIKGPGSLRLSGRPRQQSSLSSLQNWLDDAAGEAETESSISHGEHHLFDSGLVGQLAQWIRDEKVKREARRARRKAKKAPPPALEKESSIEKGSSTESHTVEGSNHHEGSDTDDSVDLDTLEQIVKESFPFGKRIQRKLSSSRTRPTSKRLHRASSVAAASSDTEHVDGDVLVPTAEVVLDNSKTLSYKGGAAKSSDDLLMTRQLTSSEDAWMSFKFEVLRLIHTLRLKGWRRVPLDMSAEISIDRLSGALTNAVYVVSPPIDLPEPETPAGDEAPRTTTRRKPPRLLLRIYGPQVEHLIDRESELQILRRLCRKNIGPRMLGTFTNGRFEEFFNAKPLTPEELRNPDTSRHIAKRMRELHDGIDLLEYERQRGPFVWQNWDKWLARVQNIVEWLDSKVEETSGKGVAGQGYICGTPWALFHDTLFKYRKWLERQLGGIKGLLEEMVFAHNDTQYGNILRMIPSTTSPLLLPANSHKQLVVIDFEYSNANTPGLEFANHFSEWTYNYHDEAAPWRCSHLRYPTPEEQERFIRAYIRHRPEYNIMTPKMEPQKSISAENVPSGPCSQFTNPFDSSNEDGTKVSQAAAPTTALPHRPSGPSQSISNFMLDARNPNSATLSPGSVGAPNTSPTLTRTQALSDTSADYDANEDLKVKKLLQQTRFWRMANSAQWVAWGIVQAKIPGMPDFEGDSKEGEKTAARSASILEQTIVEEPEITKDSPEKLSAAEKAHEEAEKKLVDKELGEEAEAEEDAEFDYLAYARDRAMFFWGDAVALGFVKLNELPEDVQKDIKMIDY